jgi:putative peptidoglycan lipid II flippase
MTDPSLDEPREASVPAAPVARIGRASTLLASGTAVSRVLGFISVIVLARTIGVLGSGAADTFRLANQLPNNIYAIIAGGLLSAVLVPQIVRASVQRDGGEAFINRLVTLGILLFTLCAAVATLCAPLLVRLYATSSDTAGFTDGELALATAFAYWCLPQILFYAIYSLLGEVLNARGVFGPFTWTPALNNVITISSLLAFGALFGSAKYLAADAWTPAMIALLAGGATLGIAVQALTLFLFWKRAGLRYRPDFRWRGVGLRAVGKSASWVFAMILVTQLAGVVEVNVATIPQGDNPSVGVMSTAWLIAMLPHSIIAVSVTTAYFTRMSTHTRDGDLVALRSDLISALRTILLFMIFATAALAVVALPFSAVFDDRYTSVLALGGALLATLLALVPFSVMFVFQRIFFALEDTRMAFFLQSGRSVLFVALALLVPMFPDSQIVIVLCVVGAIAGVAQTIVAGVILHRRLGGIGVGELGRQAAWFLAAVIPAAGVGIVILLVLGGFGPGAFPVSSDLGGLASVALAGFGMTVVYVAVLALTRNPELVSLAAPLTRRLGGIARR